MTSSGGSRRLDPPYNYNSATFIADPHAIQQGYVTSEPYSIEKQGHFTPNVFLLSDYGYSSYATTIISRKDLVDDKPDVVQRSVDASAACGGPRAGWAPANQCASPEATASRGPASGASAPDDTSTGGTRACSPSTASANRATGPDRSE